MKKKALAIIFIGLMLALTSWCVIKLYCLFWKFIQEIPGGLFRFALLAGSLAVIVVSITLTAYLEVETKVPVKKVLKRVALPFAGLSAVPALLLNILKPKKAPEKVEIYERKCPSCGWEVGTKTVCPHCSARTYGRISQKHIIFIAATLLVISILLFKLAAVYSETELVNIGALGEEHNFRHIRVIGKVTDAPRFYPDEYGTSGLLRFYLNDTTGELSVKSESGVTRKLMEQNKIPGFGDVVDVEGTLYAGEEYRVLKLRSADSLKISPRYYEKVPLALIDGKKEGELPQGELVELHGEVSAKIKLSFAYIIDVADEEGNQVTVFVPQSIIDLTGLGDLGNIWQGSEVTVRGALKWYDSKNDYYDRWELVPATTKDIVLKGIPTNITGEPGYLQCTISDLLTSPSSYEAGLVRLENVTVTDAGSYAEGYGEDPATRVEFRVSDSSTTASLLVYAEGGATRPLELSLGDRVTLQGLFTKYGGRWELKIRADTTDSIEKVEVEG